MNYPLSDTDLLHNLAHLGVRVIDADDVGPDSFRQD